MIIGVDIGGTKTLIGVFDDTAEVQKQVRFETPQDYESFLNAFRENYASLDVTSPASICVVAAPGFVNRTLGTVIYFGNLPWRDVPLQQDIEKIVGCRTLAENDANLAGLSEALTRQAVDKTVLYVTISTGIGTGIIDAGIIDKTLEDSEGGNMLLPFNGTLQIWEKFASGKAIVAEYGKPARDIDDPKIWDEIVERWWLGFVELCSVVEPDLIVIGGGVGSHFDKYGDKLKKRIADNLPPIIRMPHVEKAINAEGAALLGTYYLALQKLG